MEENEKPKRINDKITRTLSAAPCHDSFANRLPTNGPFWILFDT